MISFKHRRARGKRNQNDETNERCWAVQAFEKLWNATMLQSWLIVRRGEESFSQCDHRAAMELMVPNVFFFFNDNQIAMATFTTLSCMQRVPYACNTCPLYIPNPHLLHHRACTESPTFWAAHTHTLTRNNWSHRSVERLPALVINNTMRNWELSKALKVLFVHEQGITARYATTLAQSL